MKIPTEKQIQPYLDAGIVSRVDRGPLSIYNYTHVPRGALTSSSTTPTRPTRTSRIVIRTW